MGNVKFFIALVVISAASQIQNLHAQSCPTSWNPAPCFCEDGIVWCNKTSKIISSSQLEKIFYLRDSGTIRMGTLRIQNAELEIINGSKIFGFFAFREIIISRTKTKWISDDALKGQVFLDELQFISNEFDKFNFKAIHHLRHLDKLQIQESFLDDIPNKSFRPFANLSINTIDLSYNKLQIIRKRTFTELPILKRIILSGNEITTLEEYAFNLLRLYQPIDIYLNGNNLTEDGIHKNAFPAGLRLKMLILSFNRLKTLPMKNFQPILDVMADVDGSMLEVSGNPFVCDITISWLVTKSETYKNKIRGVICPNGKSLNELTLDDLE